LSYELVTGEDGKPVELGRGAMGVTYKAFDIDLHCPVTQKVISERYLGDESARIRFLREARAAAKVRHQNVASVFHLGRTGQNYFYAMEFVEGETLENLIKCSGPLEVKLALEIVSQVTSGLAAVHKQRLGQVGLSAEPYAGRPSGWRHPNRAETTPAPAAAVKSTKVLRRLTPKSSPRDAHRRGRCALTASMVPLLPKGRIRYTAASPSPS
jgi:serine/threonine protein kinase